LVYFLEQFIMSYGNGAYGSDGCVIRLRGLPWSVGKEEVSGFLSGCNVTNIHFTYNRDGRPSGEAYVELETESDVSLALSKNQQHMGKRYIEVFRSKTSEMEFALSRDSVGGYGSMNEDAVVRLRGLPFSCTHDDIIKFFQGMQIVPNGIALLADEMGRASGEAYVQFATQPIADQALQKHKERIGTRYVEIFKSSMMEAENAIAIQGRYDIPGGPMAARGGRPGPYDRPMAGGRGGMRGMRGGGMMRGGRGGNLKGVLGSYNSYADEMGYDDMGYGSGYGAYGSGGRMGGMMRGRGGMSHGPMMEPFQSATGHSVHMRGLPYSATEADVIKFFAPLSPAMVVFQYNADGRPSGEADVDFNTHFDAEAAMKKHKAMMGTRYIELFLNSATDNSLYGGGAMGGAAGDSEFFMRGNATYF